MATESFAIADLTGGQLNAMVKKLGGPDAALRLLRDELEVREVAHIIDLDAPPLIPVDGWRMEEHRKGGQFKWDPNKVDLWLSPNQQNGKTIEGHKLAKEWADRPVFNANLLVYLLNHSHLIPESWKQNAKGQTLYIFFPGTKYRGPDGDLSVLYLYWCEGLWQAHYGWLDNDWDGQYPVAVPASEA